MVIVAFKRFRLLQGMESKPKKTESVSHQVGKANPNFLD